AVAASGRILRRRAPGAPATVAGWCSSPRGPQRARDQILGAAAVDAVEQLIRLGGAVPKAHEPLARQRAGVVGASDPNDAVGQRCADPLAQLDDDPLCGALADPGYRLETTSVARREQRQQLARRPTREHRERDLRPNRLNGEQ